MIIIKENELICAQGPGVFFTIPCVDTHVKIDLRTATYEIPPQEVLKPIYQVKV